MGYDWAKAHELSDQFALELNEAIEARIDELTGHPNRCPHGEPIASPEGVMPLVRDQCLVEFQAGVQVQISRVETHNPNKLRYFAERGLLPGQRFILQSHAPFRGPLRLQIELEDHIIRYELASSLWVEVAA